MHLISTIKTTTDLQRLKFRQYKKLGIPNFHKFTPFQLFFKKFKKKLIENDKELSLLDAGIYCQEKWGEMSFEEQEKYIAAATLVNKDIEKRNTRIKEAIDPEMRKIREEHERRIREDKEIMLFKHFSLPTKLSSGSESEADRAVCERMMQKRRIMKLHHLRDPNMDIIEPILQSKEFKSHQKYPKIIKN